jgi:hypothetical protein
MQLTALRCESHHTVKLFAGSKLNHIDIRSRSLQSVKLRHNKTTNAIQSNCFLNRFIEFAEE